MEAPVADWPTLAAEIFARRAHAGQIDKGGAPYSGHLGRVAARARAHAEAMGLPIQHAEWCQQVGWLHDTIEDTDTTADDLLDAGFDPAVVQAVQLLTRPLGKPYLECVAGIIASGDRLAMIVKLSDNEDNLDPSRSFTAASPEHELRYRRSAEMLRAALALTPSTSTTARGPRG
ncbi:phosphohydrolase [Methylorubrum sp. DB1722]|nr:phosphohydrolase [Methylorubrum sp. DB1722]